MPEAEQLAEENQRLKKDQQQTVLTSLLKRFIGIGTYWNQIWSLENQTITQPPIYLGFN